MSEELKACPFCGKQPEVKSGHDPENEWFWVQCVASEDEEGCDNVMSEMQDDYNEAVKDWNTRPIEDALQAENARLREALEWYADIDNWFGNTDGDSSPVQDDAGFRARNALKGAPHG